MRFMRATLAAAIAVSVVAAAATRADAKKKGKPFPQVEILYNTLESHKQIAEAIAQMWKDNLGVTVGLGNTEWKVYLDRMSKLDYDIARGGWVYDYNDPHNGFECWQTGNGNNRTGWTNPEYDKLIGKAMLERDNSKRWEVYQKAEQMIVDEAPFLPIYFYVNKNMVAKKVKGWEDNVLNLHPYDAMWIADDAGNKLPPEQQKLVFNNAAEPQTLDPAIMTGHPEHRIALGLFEGLTRPSPKDLSPLPGVAEKWEISEDGKTYTFHLREAYWSNGDPITAEDFIYSWKRVIDPKALTTPSEYAQIFDWIEGARPVIRGQKPAEGAKLGLEAPNPKTLVVRLEAPCPFFLNLCLFETYMPVHRKTVEKHGPAWTKAENIVTNGPYKLEEWKINSQIVFVPNERYWDKGRVTLQQVTLLPIDNLDTSLNKFIAGECDWIDDVPIARAEEVKKHSAFRVSPYLTVYFYRFNCSRPPFNDVRVRKAFSMAVNKKTICTRVQRFGEIPAGSCVPPRCGNPPYKSVKGLEYNPEAAKKLLAEAGYEVN
jgi:ABC-type oligopeptide transport system substrate-binding subunit